MALTPNDVQKMRFATRLRGYDPSEVEAFLGLVADELQGRLSELERVQQAWRDQQDALREAQSRQRELQEALLRAQKVAEEIVASAHKEAELLLKEAELTGDRIVNQSLEQATHIESKITELRLARREVQARLQSTIDLYQRILEADREEERTTATLHTLSRPRRK